jgi:TonB family protein
MDDGYHVVGGQMKKLCVAMLSLLCFSISDAADKQKNESLWISDDKGCKAYSRWAQPLDSIEWTGTCLDGYVEGEGILSWFRDGALEYVITGHFIQGKLQGRGVFETLNAAEYAGRLEADFVDNLPDGQGIQTWPDGSRYEGAFKKGYAHGWGVKTWANGVRYEGEFDHNEVLSERYKLAELKTDVVPFYPRELRGKQGRVSVIVSIGEDNQIKKVEVIRSDHPLLERAVIRSLQKASIKAAQLDGKPVPTMISVPFVFNQSSEATSNASLYPAKASKSFPEMFQYDRPPFDKIVAPLVYPFDSLRQGSRGNATVSFVIDPEGQPKQVTLVESSEPAFGESLQAMLASSSFFPARKNKRSSWSGFALKKVFKQYGSVDTVISEHGRRILSELEKAQPNIVPVSQLDVAPRPFYTPAPVYSPELVDKKVKGSVQVEFYIDREGVVQFPHALKTDNQALAWLALTAVSRWQFYPPTVKGKPVDAVLTVPVAFNLKE